MASSLELEVISGEAGTYRVAARSQAGDTEGTPTSFPFDEIALERHRQAVEFALMRSAATVRRLAPAEERPVQEFGTRLFDFLFPAELREHLAAARNQAARDGIPMQVRLRIRPPELAILPWEFLYDQGRDEYLSLTVPVVRYLEVLEPLRPLVATAPLRVLAMVARPGDLTALDVEHERRRLEQAVAGLEKSGEVRLSWVEGQTWQDLESALDQGGWHIFHFIGHGGFDSETGEGVLALGDESGGVYRLAASDLGMLIGDHRSLRLVVLNSCESGRASGGDVFSSTAAVLMRRGVPAVVAMQYDISDAAAIAFARGLYSAVAARLPVDQAVTRARRAIKLTRRNTLEWATPVLYLRSADAAIFAPGESLAARPVPLPRLETTPEPPPAERSASLAGHVEVPAAHVEVPAQRTAPTPLPEPAPAQAPRVAAIQSDPTPLARLDHDAPVSEIAFSPDGSRLVTVSSRTVRLWDRHASQREIARLHHERGIAGIALSPDSTRIATQSAPGMTVKPALLWDIATGKETARLAHSGNMISQLKFVPSGTRLATGAYKSVRLWDPATGKMHSESTHPHAITHVAFSPDSRRMILLSKRKKPGTLWDVSTGEQVSRIQHEDAMQSVIFSPDSTRLVSFARDGSTFLWNSADGTKVSWVGMTRVWEAATGRERPWAERVANCTAAFSPDCTLLAIASDDKSVRLWNPASGQLVRALPHPGVVSAIMFSPDGTSLTTTVGGDHMVRLWDPASGEQVASLSDGYRLGFNLDGTRLVTIAAVMAAGRDHTLRVWDVTSGQELSTLPCRKSTPLIFSPDRTQVAYLADLRTVCLLDTASGAVLAQLRHDHEIDGLMFSPDGGQLATRSGKTVQLWAT